MKKRAVFLLLAVVFAIMCGVQAIGCAEGPTNTAIEFVLTELSIRLDAFCETAWEEHVLEYGTDQIAEKIYYPEQNNGLALKGFAWARSLEPFDYSAWHLSAYDCGDQACATILDMYEVTKQFERLSLDERAPLGAVDVEKFDALLESNGGGFTIQGEESAYLWLNMGSETIAIYPFYIIERTKDGVTMYEAAHYLYFAHTDPASGAFFEWVVADQDDVHDLLKLLMAVNPNINDLDYQIMQYWCQYHELISEPGTQE